MKKLLRDLLAVVGLISVCGSAFAQVPVISYASSTYALSTSTATNIPLTNTGGTVGAGNPGYTTAALDATVANYAFAITTTAAGTSYYLQEGAGGNPTTKIYQLAGTTTTTMTISGVTLNKPAAIGIDGAGNLYVADAGNGVIYKFTVTGTTATLAATIGTSALGNIDDPVGIAFDASNNVYIADDQDGGTTDGTVFEIAAGTTTVTSYITGLNNPKGVAVDASGNTYVSEPASNTVLKINSGGTVSTVAGTYNNPQALTTDAAGDLFVADYGDTAVKEVSAAGVASTLFTTVSPAQVSFDGTKNMYIATALGTGTGNIYKSTPNTTTFYSISGTLPTGLTFSTTTGLISGTTGTAIVAPTTYTVTAWNSSGNSTTTITISVNKTGAPTISYSPSAFVYTQYNATPTPAFPSPTVTNTPTSYAVIGTALPAGLTLGATGVITGTPTTPTATATYTISAKNANGSGLTTITITVNQALPGLTYPTPNNYATGAAINITPTNNTNTGTVSSVTINPALPAGLSISSTGVITGSLSAAYTNTFTVTPSNGAGTGPVSNTFTITVAVAPAFSYVTPYNAVTGTNFSLPPTLTAGGPVTYAITTGALASGLAFNTTTGTFSGPTTANFVAKNFTITATNASTGLSSTANVTIRSNTARFAYTNPAAYTAGTAITALSPTSTFTLTNATITPALPAGLSMSASGVITGTPTAASPSTVYQVTAYDGTYYSSANVTLSVVLPAIPSITYSTTAYTWTAGIGGSSVTPSNSGGTATYSFDASTPAPAYLTINATTGVITASTACVTTPQTSYLVDATNYGGTGQATVKITIIAAVPPMISYSTSSYTFTAGTAGATVAASNSGGTATYSFDSTTPAPAYLTINSTTGVITCSTAAVATPQVSYLIDGTNAGGNSQATVNITIIPPPPTVAYTGSPYTYYTNSAITALTPATTNSPTSFTISPNLTTNTGLSFDPTTGIISGTPTLAAATQTYTVTASNANPMTGQTTISVTVLGPPTISYTGSPYTYTVGTAITTLTPAVANNPISYSISPSLNTNTGLTFSTTNGQISGTPTTVSSPAVTYTITATNPAGNGQTTISVLVNPKAPTIAYTPSTYTFPAGAGGSTSAATNTGGTATYSFDATNPAIPSWLTINPTTGVITASSAAVSSAATVYKIDASNATATVSTTVTITILAAPALNYTTPNTYLAGTAITPLTPTNTGGAVAALTYTTPGTALSTTGLSKPWGMAMDASGDIYVANSNNGTVTEYGPTGAYIGVVITTGATTALASIAIDPSGNIYVGTTGGVIYKYNSSFAAQTFTPATAPSSDYGMTTDASGDLYVADEAAAKIYEYSSSGALLQTITNATYLSQPADVQVDAAGNIYVSDIGNNDIIKFSSTGTYIARVTGLNNPYTFYIDKSGNFDVALTGAGTIGVYSSAPALITTITPTSGTKPRGVIVDASGNLYEEDYASNVFYKYTPTGGYVLNYASGTTSLPPGLTFNSTTGVISGTPAGAFSGTYTVTATNAAGPGTSNTFVINCNSKPVITYPSPDTYTMSGANITPLTPTNTGSSPITGWSVSPALPAGLTLNTSTGVITGPPNVATASASYTVTATNAYGSGSFAITIAIIQAPVLTYNTPNNYAVGTAITTLSPTNTGGAVSTGQVYNTTGTVILNSSNNLSSPYGMGVDPSGNVYVVNYALNTVTEYKVGGTVVTYSTGVPAGPVGIVFDSSGNAYIASATSKDVVKFTGGMAGLASTLVTGTQAPTGIAIDASNNIFVANLTGNGSNQITKYSTSGTLELTITRYANNYPFSAGIAVDASDNVWAADNNGGSYVDEYNAAGAFVQDFARGSGNSALYIDGANNDFLTTTTGDYVASYTPNWATANQTITPPFSSPRGVVTDQVGNLYVSDYTANTVTEFTPVSGYYLSGILPPGLSFSSTTGAITGTPTAAYSGSYTVTAYNAAGPGVSNTFVINCGYAPTITYTTPDNYAESSSNITPLTPTVTNGTPVSYSVSPALPAGLTLNTATGVITGPPNALSASTNYTVTATNGFGSGTFVISISIVIPPVITYATPTYTAVNQTMTPLGPANTGGAIPASQTYGSGNVIMTGLNGPVGMAVDPSGNVYVTNEGANSVTEYSTTGTVTTFTASVPNGPVGIVFDASGNAYVLGQTAKDVVKFTGGMSGTAAGIITTGLSTPTGIAIDGSGNIYVANSGNNTITKYSISGTTATLTMTATSTNFVDANNNTIKVTGGVSVDNAGNIWFASYTGTNTYLAEFTPTAQELFTSSGLGTTKNYGVYLDGGGDIFVTGTTSKNGEIVNGVTGNTTVNETGYTTPEGIVEDGAGNFYISDYAAGTVTEYSPLTGYYLNGVLPPSLSFDNTTGIISGIPSGPLSASYTVTGYVSGVAATSNTFVINCGYAPIISYTTPDDFLINTTITSLTPTVGGNPATGPWSVSPSLPAGLTFNTSTGVISGAPTALEPPTNYIVSSSNIYGTGSGTVNITVYAPPAYTYSPNPDVLAVNAAMTPLPPVTSTGGGAPIPNATTPYNTTGISFKTGLSNPWGITTDANGNVYVANYGSKNVTEYNSSGTLLGTYTAAAGAVTGVAVDPYGNVYAITTNGVLYKYTAFGAGVIVNQSIYYLDFTYGSNPADYGIVSDPSGNLYITDEAATTFPGATSPPAVWKYTLGTGQMVVLIPKGSTNFRQPSGITVDASGNIYILDLYNQKLVKFNSAGTYVGATISGLNTPYGVTIDALGNIFIGDAGTKTVKEYSSTGTLIQTIATGTPASPRGIAEDPSYNLYVTDYTNGTVTKYQPNLYTITAGGALPPGITFNQYTGTFSGTPTSVFGPVTYTISSTGMGGSSGTTTETLSCYLAYDWVGTTSSDWNVTTNWLSKTVPGAANTANIGVNVAFTNQPTVGLSGAASISVGAIQIGNTGGQAATLTVNNGYTLNVVTTSGGSGNITKQSDANSLQTYATGSSLAGAGTINAVNVAVVGSTTLASAYTETFASSVTSLKLSGTIQLTSGFNNVTNFPQNATFNVTGGVTSAATALTSSNQTGGTSTFGVVPTTTGTLQLAFATPLSGLGAAGTNVVNFKNPGATIEYSGAAQTFYTDAGVSALSNTISYQNIKFSGTGIKSPPSAPGNLNVAGDFTNALTLNDAADYVLLTGTPVYFNGTIAQNIYAGNGTGTTFKNITFNGTGASTIVSGMAYVNDAGLLTMAGTATLATGGYLTLQGDATGCAAVAPIASGTPITGSVNVQRFVQNVRGYRLMSSPVNAGTTGNGAYSLNYLLTKMYLTGSGPGFTNTGNPTLFLYNESFVPQYSTFYNSNYIAISSMTGTGTTPVYPINVNGAGLTGSYSVPAGNGFYVFYRGNPAAEGVANVTNAGYTGIVADTVTATGMLNQGQIIFKDWYSQGSNYLGATSQDFNLIGNPYASAIDLSTIQGGSTTTGIYAPIYNGTTGIAKFIYELNPVTNIYGIYTTDNSAIPTNGASQYIGSGQGFFVEANGTTSQFIFNESAKATTATNANAEGLMARRVSYAGAVNTGSTNPSLKLTMTMDSVHNEETLLLFNPHSKTTYAFNEDAPHKKGEGLVGFSSRSSDSVLMAINSMPLQASQVIPLNVYATNNGVYTISMEQLNSLPLLYDVWLKDAYMKDSLDIKHNPTYSFDLNNSIPASFGTERFTLVIRQNQALMVHLLSFTALKFTTGDNVAWTVENESNYTHFAVQRSTDGGKTFVTLDSLVSSSLGAYSYLDAKPVQGANSYRLQLTDLNGEISYSAVVTIMYANTGNTITLNNMMVYPNPTNGPMNLAINVNSGSNNGSLPSPTYHIQVTNNLGVVIRNTNSKQPVWQTDVSSLMPGTYFITVTNAGDNSVVGKSAFVKL